jgi:hypothetical protein
VNAVQLSRLLLGHYQPARTEGSVQRSGLRGPIRMAVMRRQAHIAVAHESAQGQRPCHAGNRGK